MRTITRQLTSEELAKIDARLEKIKQEFDDKKEWESFEDIAYGIFEEQAINARFGIDDSHDRELIDLIIKEQGK